MEKKWIFWMIAALCVFFGLAYFVFPADFIPDVIAFIGWLDDLVVNLMMLVAMTTNVLLALGVLPLRRKEQEFERDYGEYGYYEER